MKKIIQKTSFLFKNLIVKFYYNLLATINVVSANLVE